MRSGHLYVSLVMALLLVTSGCSRKKSGGTDGGLGSELASGLGLHTATGHVESTGSTGTWQLDSGECYSGDDDGYFGIFVKSRSDKRVWVKLVKDPLKGWNVGVSVPDTCKAGPKGQQCDVEYFDAHACSTLDVGLEAYAFRGKSSAGRHQFDGNVSFDCTAGKAHVSGKLKVEKCTP